MSRNFNYTDNPKRRIVFRDRNVITYFYSFSRILAMPFDIYARQRMKRKVTGHFPSGSAGSVLQPPGGRVKGRSGLRKSFSFKQNGRSFTANVIPAVFPSGWSAGPVVGDGVFGRDACATASTRGKMKESE